MLTGATTGCATPSPAEEPRPHPPPQPHPPPPPPPPPPPRPPSVVADASRVAYWDQVAKALAELTPPCSGGPSQGLGSTGIVVPAACFFSADEATLNVSSRPVVATIARELNRASDREFWINVRTPAGRGGAIGKDAARAAAVVAALVAAGVAPERLAAVVGTDDGGSSRAPVAGAFVEIVVVPIVND